MSHFLNSDEERLAMYAGIGSEVEKTNTHIEQLVADLMRTINQIKLLDLSKTAYLQSACVSKRSMTDTHIDLNRYQHVLSNPDWTRYIPLFLSNNQDHKMPTAEIDGQTIKLRLVGTDRPQR